MLPSQAAGETENNILIDSPCKLVIYKLWLHVYVLTQGNTVQTHFCACSGCSMSVVRGSKGHK